VGGGDGTIDHLSPRAMIFFYFPCETVLTSNHYVGVVQSHGAIVRGLPRQFPAEESMSAIKRSRPRSKTTQT